MNGVKAFFSGFFVAVGACSGIVLFFSFIMWDWNITKDFYMFHEPMAIISRTVTAISILVGLSCASNS